MKNARPLAIPEAPTLAGWAWPGLEGEAKEAKASYLLRSHALEQLSDLLVGRGLSVLLVKGAALAMRYPLPWSRPMGDIDVIVRPADLARIRRVLERAGWRAMTLAGRPFTETALEIAYASPEKHGSVLLEIHLGLDKVVGRNIDVESLFGRASTVPERPALRIPSDEDHLVLVALHLAADEFRHRTGIVDLEVLIRAGADIEAAFSRAREWGAVIALYVALRTLSVLCSEVMPLVELDPITPTPRQLLMLSFYFRIGQWPVARQPTLLGWRWLLRQTVLRDDKLGWARGVGRYALLRARELAVLRR